MQVVVPFSAYVEDSWVQVVITPPYSMVVHKQVNTVSREQ